MGVVLVGCSGPIPFEKFCAAQLRANCERLQRCGVVTRTADCSTQWAEQSCVVYAQAISQGAVRYDAQEAGRCIDEIRSAACDAFPVVADLPPACRRAIQGGPAGSACGACAAGLVCTFGTGQCGVCEGVQTAAPKAKAELGQPCSPRRGDQGGCVGDLACDSDGQGVRTCMQRVPAGSSCDLGRSCELGLICRPEGHQLLCGQLAELGEPCDTIRCKSRLRCVEGRCLAQLKDGESCISHDQCASLNCVGTCQQLAEVGQPCDLNCRRELTCVDGFCAVPKPAGERCRTHSECAGRGECVEDVCHDLLIDCH